MSSVNFGSYVGARYDYNKAKSQEKFANNFGTAVALAGTGGAAYAVNTVAKANPKKMVKLYKAADKYVTKGLDFAMTYGGKALEKINSTKIGNKITTKLGEWITKAGKKIGKTEKGKKVITKVIDAVEKFASSSSAKRGKYMLVAAGLAAVVGGAIHIIRQHDRNDGAIDQKYNDINALSKII